MHGEQTIEFVLMDRTSGVEITPSTIGFSRFNEFNQQVAEILVGSERFSLGGSACAGGKGLLRI
jgi:hypothetical protein